MNALVGEILVSVAFWGLGLAWRFARVWLRSWLRGLVAMDQGGT
jgi:hypothetical protein